MPAVFARACACGSAATKASTSAGGGCMPQTKALCATCGVLIQSHGQQHVGGAGHSGGAGRARGGLNPCHVQQEQQGIAFAAGEGEVRVAGQPLAGFSAGSTPRSTASGTAWRTAAMIASRSPAMRRALGGKVFRDVLCGRGKGCQPGGVKGSRANSAFLARHHAGRASVSRPGPAAARQHPRRRQSCGR